MLEQYLSIFDLEKCSLNGKDTHTSYPLIAHRLQRSASSMSWQSLERRVRRERFVWTAGVQRDLLRCCVRRVVTFPFGQPTSVPCELDFTMAHLVLSVLTLRQRNIECCMLKTTRERKLVATTPDTCPEPRKRIDRHTELTSR